MITDPTVMNKIVKKQQSLFTKNENYNENDNNNEEYTLENQK